MIRRIERTLLDKWINEAYPDAITKLARKSRVPASSISKIRNGRVPKDSDQRRRLAKAIDVTEDELFPVVEGAEERAG